MRGIAFMCCLVIYESRNLRSNLFIQRRGRSEADDAFIPSGSLGDAAVGVEGPRHPWNVLAVLLLAHSPASAAAALNHWAFSVPERCGCHASSTTRRRAGVPTASEFWGKERTLGWEKMVLSLQHEPPKNDGDNQLLCHPVAHLFWTTPDVTGGPSVARVNSATKMLQLPVRWPVVFEAAARLEVAGGEEPPEGILQATRSMGSKLIEPSEGIVRATRSLDGKLIIADTESLEICIAHALVERSVRVQLCQTASVMTLTCPKMLSIDDGWEVVARRERDVTLLIKPEALFCSRDTELCCLPKVWQLSKVLCANGSKGATWDDVGASWCPELCHWIVSHRHRTLACALASIPLRCRVLLPQICSIPSETLRREWWGPPSKHAIKRAQKAAEAFKDALGTDNLNLETLTSIVQQAELALIEAPLESAAAGLSHAHLQNLRTKLQSSNNIVNKSKQASKQARRAAEALRSALASEGPNLEALSSAVLKAEMAFRNAPLECAAVGLTETQLQEARSRLSLHGLVSR